MAAVSIGLVTAILTPLRGEINTTTKGFAFLLVLLSVAIVWGSGPALVASVAGVL